MTLLLWWYLHKRPSSKGLFFSYLKKMFKPSFNQVSQPKTLSCYQQHSMRVIVEGHGVIVEGSHIVTPRQPYHSFQFLTAKASLCLVHNSSISVQSFSPTTTSWIYNAIRLLQCPLRL